MAIFDAAVPPGYGQVVRVTGETLLGPPYVYYPVGLAASGDLLFVSDWYTGSIWKVDASAAAPVPSLIASGLVNPEGLALDDSGGLLVVETGTQRLVRVDLATGGVSTVAENLSIGLLGATPSTPPHLALNGVAVAPSSDIFVAGDQANVLHRIKPRTASPGCGFAPSSY